MPKKEPPPELELRKGAILLVKAPPYYNREYPYEVVSAGTNRVCAHLYNCPRVRKSWNTKELALLFEMKIVRLGDATTNTPNASDSH